MAVVDSIKKSYNWNMACKRCNTNNVLYVLSISCLEKMAK